MSLLRAGHARRHGGQHEDALESFAEDKDADVDDARGRPGRAQRGEGAAGRGEEPGKEQKCRRSEKSSGPVPNNTTATHYHL